MAETVESGRRAGSGSVKKGGYRVTKVAGNVILVDFSTGKSKAGDAPEVEASKQPDVKKAAGM